MMNAAIVSNIISNGGASNQQVANGSHLARDPLLSSIEFSLSEVQTNFSKGRSLTKLAGKEEVFNGQNKTKNCDQNKTKICDQNKNSVTEMSYMSMNVNKEKSTEDSIPIPKVQLYTDEIRVEWSRVYKIGAGLHNLGNTCFMNTVIQCLTYCPPLANYLLQDSDHSSKCTVVGFCMMCLLQRHMKRAIGKTGEVIKPLDVYQRLKLIAKHFQFGRQEDAHEFLRYVIDHLWKSCLPQTNGVTKLDGASKETTVINKIFGGYHRSQVICLRCKKQSNTFDHFMDFILDIKQNVMTLEKALEKFTQPELLQQENCYKCPKCKMKVEAQKRFSVYRAPTVATFQLKRFDYNRPFGGKVTKQITYPEKLNLRPYMSETQGDPVWYHLNAVIVHSGSTCNSGHYFCYVKNSNGLWYIMDDQRVYQVSLNQVLNQSAYVLFYIKMENSGRPAPKKCPENKNTAMKGTISNSHFVKVSEMSALKSIPLGEKSSPFNVSRLYSSPGNVDRFNISNENREKSPFALQTNGSPTSLTSPKNRMSLLEPLSTLHSGLVPYVEDTSESSGDSDSSLPSNSQLSNVKRHAKNGSIDSYRSTPQLQIKTKLSKSIQGLISPSPTPKVSATGSWIVTDAPHTITSSSSCATGVTSTTDWQVIESSELKQSFDCGRIDSPPQAPLAETIASKHSANEANSSVGVKVLGEREKCNFRRQIYKVFSPEEDEAINGFKRKSSNSYSKVSKDSPYSEHSEGRHSPLSKKAKFAEDVPLLNQENGIRNSSSSRVDNCLVQRQYSVSSHCDNNSRTPVVNGDVFRSSHVADDSVEKEKKFGVSSKGKQDSSSVDSKPLQYGKEKLPISNSGKNSSLYGTEIPTWREENHHRPSIVSGHENRRIFDDYDHEFDHGKVRKSKVKDRYQYFHQKNPFQKHADRYHGKYNNKFFHNPHNYRKYDPHHYWKSNHSNHHQRYRNHHHRHY